MVPHSLLRPWETPGKGSHGGYSFFWESKSPKRMPTLQKIEANANVSLQGRRLNYNHYLAICLYQLMEAGGGGAVGMGV